MISLVLALTGPADLDLVGVIENLVEAIRLGPLHAELFPFVLGTKPRAVLVDMHI